MKVAVVNGRTSLVVGDRLVDAERASGGAVPADPAAMFAAWPALLLATAARLDLEGPPSGAPPLDHGALGSTFVPVPLQAFGIGLNYADHAGESAMALPDRPLVFPKFSSCIAGPNEPVATRSACPGLGGGSFVVVIGADCYEVDAADALSVIAGYTVGQDLSDRVVQFEGGANPQFGLGKSAPGFGPVGPWVVSADELGAAGRLDIRCDVDGVTKQSSNTCHLIFDVPALVEYLSYRVRLHAGDLIFTGTPAGVGMGREPREVLCPGSRIDTTISGTGNLDHAGDRAVTAPLTDGRRFPDGSVTDQAHCLICHLDRAPDEAVVLRRRRSLRPARWPRAWRCLAGTSQAAPPRAGVGRA